MRVRCRLYALLALLWVAAAPRARALLTFNQGKDRVFVNATYTFGFDTNVFTQQVARSSVTQSASIGLSYARKAGAISVNASVGWSIGQFDQFKSQNFVDPSYSLSFTKGHGRTTGSLDLSAQRENNPDPDANNRSISWDYSAALNLRYPVNERYFFTDGITYTSAIYTNSALFTNLGSEGNALDLNYVYDSKLNLSAGYSLGRSRTFDTTDYDHSLNFGASGSLLPKLTGSIGFGYGYRDSLYSGHRDDYSSLTANGSLNYRFSHLVSFAGTVNKGFSTTSTDISTDVTSASINADLSLIHSLRTALGLDYTETAFLGARGLGRADTLWQFTANLGTAITTHLRTNLAYAYEVNYSNSSGAAFTRQDLSLNLQADY